MKWNDDIEFAVYCLEHPEMQGGEEFRAWMEVPGHSALWEDVRSYREAYLRKEDKLQVDVEKEYRRIAGRIRRRKWQAIWWKGGAVAAMVAVVLCVWMLLERRLVEEKEVVVGTEVLVGRQAAELVLASGERIALGGSGTSIRAENGECIAEDSCSRLSYQFAGAGENVGEAQVEYNMVNVPGGADYTVELADGTVVHLNCETTLRYPVRFTGKERRVFLEGEAFFEVTKSEEIPFVVDTRELQVVVTGTKFDVKAYEEEETVSATLVEGGVKVRATGAGGENGIKELKPSQQYVLDVQSHRAEVREVDVQLYTGWVDGMFVFKNQRLEEVMTMLARWYSVDVFYVGESVKDIRLSAYLGRYEHIDSVLDVIRATNKIDFVRKGNVVTVMKK